MIDSLENINPQFEKKSHNCEKKVITEKKQSTIIYAFFYITLICQYRWTRLPVRSNNWLRECSIDLHVTAVTNWSNTCSTDAPRSSSYNFLRLCVAFVMMLVVVVRMVMVAVHGGHSCIATPLCGHQSTARDTHTATTS